jgi:uncharacterized protein (TIGR00730 family)
MKKQFKNIAIFCGSNFGVDPSYPDVCNQLAELFASYKIGLVYGGAKVGVMGLIADAMLARGVPVTGVIPKKILDKEVAHDSLTELHVVETMHERKALMSDLADGFIMLPGGTGSLEEFFEVHTWALLRYHHKPCGMLNVNGYFDHLIQFLEVMETQKFIRPENRDLILVDETPQGLLDQFYQHEPALVDKWLCT